MLCPFYLDHVRFQQVKSENALTTLNTIAILSRNKI